uniref:Phospholipid scramblase n=1 Tax=Wollemia nobilis TaxID=56998 RepID=A0A0C9S9X3_9CONI
MNKVGRWFHIIQRTNGKHEIKTFKPDRKGMERVTADNSLHNGMKRMNFRLYKEGVLGCVSAIQLHSGRGTKNVQGSRSLSVGIFEGSNLCQSLSSPKFRLSRNGSMVHPFKLDLREGHSLSREWLVQLWLEENKRKSLKHKRQHKRIQNASPADFSNQTSFFSFRLPFDIRPKSVRPGPELQPVGSGGPPVNQPPVTQSLDGILNPTSLEEEKIAPLLARANLLITRDVEWANLMLGFEQENRYAIVDPSYPQTPVGFIQEQSSILMRQAYKK